MQSGFSLDPPGAKVYIRTEFAHWQSTRVMFPGGVTGAVTRRLTPHSPIPDMFQASVSGLYVDQQTGEPVVVLREIDGDRVLPIWISSNELLVLAIELSGSAPPRPLSHDLVDTAISRLNAKVVRSIVSGLEDHIYRARLFLESGAGLLELDSRPSDAIILTLKAGAPIFVADEVVEERIRLSRAEGQDPEAIWSRLQEIRPEDLNTHSL